MGLESESECFTKMMSSMPGFRFHPTDEELIMYYLKRKMSGKKLKLDVIRETDVYKWEPEELPGIFLFFYLPGTDLLLTWSIDLLSGLIGPNLDYV